MGAGGAQGGRPEPAGPRGAWKGGLARGEPPSRSCGPAAGAGAGATTGVWCPVSRGPARGRASAASSLWGLLLVAPSLPVAEAGAPPSSPRSPGLGSFRAGLFAPLPPRRARPLVPPAVAPPTAGRASVRTLTSARPGAGSDDVFTEGAGREVSVSVPAAGEGEVHSRRPPETSRVLFRSEGGNGDGRRRGSSAVTRGSVASARPAARHGLGTCHGAFRPRFPGALGAAGTAVGALRSPPSQAPGGDAPFPGGTPAAAGGRAGGRALTGAGAPSGGWRGAGETECVGPRQAGRRGAALGGRGRV